jgi:hypothetical protein
MRSYVFPLAIISLLTPVYFMALQAPRSTQAVVRSTSQQLQEVPEGCPVTRPPAQPFVPPPPYWTDHDPDGFWFGTKKLWTLLRNNGIWGVLALDSNGGIAHAQGEISSYSQKQGWYREGYDWHKDPGLWGGTPLLSVTGKRLDAPAPPLKAYATIVSSHPPYMMVGFDIPTLGCWKITGRFEDTEMSFVVWLTSQLPAAVPN